MSTTPRFITPGLREPVHGRRPGPLLPTRRSRHPPACVRATLRITALGLVEPWLNGTRVGDEVLAPGWTSYRHRLAVTHPRRHRRWSATARTSSARSSARGGRSDASGWENRRNHYSDRPGAAAPQLELEYPDRTETSSSPDDAFRAATGAIRSSSIYDGEVFDARARARRAGSTPGSTTPTGRRSSRSSGRVDALFEPTAAPIRRIEELAPVRDHDAARAGSTIVDFGQNISGWVRITVRGTPATPSRCGTPRSSTDGELDFETAAHREGDRRVRRSAATGRDVGAAVHLPRLPLRRGRRLAGRARRRRRPRGRRAQRHGAHRLVRDLERAA